MEELTRIARVWSLSSIGARGVADCDPSAILDHPSLARIYVDRVIGPPDVSRLGHPRVKEAVQETISTWPEIWPEVAKRPGRLAYPSI